ncbi:MAG: hypothetical protein M3R24_26210 [Chloroflexota bacterium]|nr:hypothetical protein [Chloroflexota bacterium]PLS82887.1 MAG: hypothetical protein CYG59_02755 [Chloroflexota bacterium]
MNIFNRASKDRETNAADQQQMGPNDQLGLDVAESATRFSISMVEAGLEVWRASAGLFFSQQDQADRMIRVWLDQGRISREQAQSLQRDLAELFRRNQADVQRMVHDAVQRTFSLMQQGQTAGVEELQQQLRHIGEQIDTSQHDQQK